MAGVPPSEACQAGACKWLPPGFVRARLTAPSPAAQRPQNCCGRHNGWLFLRARACPGTPVSRCVCVCAHVRSLLWRSARLRFLQRRVLNSAPSAQTFRKDSDSVWSGIKGGLALAYFGTPLGWRLTPGLAWQLYLSEFYKPIAEARPHAGHLALARLENERFGGDRCTVVTMNVDGLHTAAGSSDVVEVHGTVNRVLCK